MNMQTPAAALGRSSRGQGGPLSRAARRAGHPALLSALALALASCHTTHVVWSNPGADQAALQSDWQTCAELARTVESSDHVGGPAMSTATESQIAAHESAQYGGQSSAQAANRDAAQYAVISTSRPQVSCMIGRGWRLTPQP